MYKALLAVIVAAGCAAMLVGLVPPPSPATAAVQSAERGVSDAVKPVPAARSVDMRNSGCAQAWPYYEQSCLRDSRRLDGSAGAVRVIATGKPASERVRQARREQ